jgi:4'-phosphopantetheinyl transferase
MSAAAPERPWPEAAAVPDLAGGIHVWRVPLDPGPAALTRFEATLSSDERARADRFVFPQHRQAFVAARGALRELLGRYLGVPAATLGFEVGPHGKPRLAGPEALHFNVAHAGAWALVAVSRQSEVGVDLEPLRPLPELAGMIPLVFDAAEAAELQGLDEAARLEAFFTGWTRKEALVKAMGAGLTFGLPRLTVSHRPGEVARLTAIDGMPEGTQAWTLLDLSFRGYRAALACAGPMPEVACRSAVL